MVYLLAMAARAGSTGCDSVCATGIGVGTGAVLLILFSLFMIWFTKRLDDKRQASLKHVGSVSSLPGHSSEYPEVDGVLTYTIDQWSPKRQIYTTQTHIPVNEVNCQYTFNLTFPFENWNSTSTHVFIIVKFFLFIY